MKGAKGLKPVLSAPVAGLLAVALLSLSPLEAAPPVRFAGELGGLVTDAAGHPQLGAVVMLFNRQDRLLQRAATDLGGTFSFNDLLPDLYSIRVTFLSFVPAMKDQVQVKPGMRSLLDISLSRVFSSVQLVSTTPAPGGLMNDDWKWILRSNASLRPILRYLPVVNNGPDPGNVFDSEKAAVFSGSRGLVRISASDGAQTTGSTGEADLGTQFAFATSLYGGNHLQFSGNVGYASASGSPAAAIRTTYSRDLASGASPAVSITMRQLFVPLRSGQSFQGSPANEASAPALRTLAVSFRDKIRLADNLSAEYGFELDEVSFIDRLHYFSPYAKLTYALDRGDVDFTWTSGNAHPELGLSAADPNADLQRDLAALSVLPQVTLDNGRSKVQRGDDYEIGFSQRFGSREYRIAGYRENVSNTTLMIANPESGLFPGDLMPDLFSNSALFNAGRFDTAGYMASVTQDLGDSYKITATYGLVGVMASRPDGPAIQTADDLRNLIEAAHRNAVTLRASGTVRNIGTRFMASYQFTDYRSSMPAPSFATQSGRAEPGLNVMIRQPIPSIPWLPWRMEASAELRNMLAQGYLPVNMPNGSQMLLVNTPRSIRGGLAFVF
jgi:hypothetical protein